MYGWEGSSLTNSVTNNLQGLQKMQGLQTGTTVGDETDSDTPLVYESGTKRATPKRLCPKRLVEHEQVSEVDKNPDLYF